MNKQINNIFFLDVKTKHESIFEMREKYRDQKLTLRVKQQKKTKLQSKAREWEIEMRNGGTVLQTI